MTDFSNIKIKRTVVISGVTTGLGKEMAKGFAERGWSVAGFGRTKTKVAELSKNLGEHHYFVAADVSNDKSMADFAKQIIDIYGAPNLLINNAALMNYPSSLWEISATEFDQITAVNINGVANMIRHFVPAMIQCGSGIIINFSSGWGRSTSPDVAPYCATKWAIEGLSSALAQELPHGMASVALNPGVIDTGMLRKCWSDGAAAYQKPDEWAQTVIPFLEEISSNDNGRQMTAP